MLNYCAENVFQTADVAVTELVTMVNKVPAAMLVGAVNEQEVGDPELHPEVVQDPIDEPREYIPPVFVTV